MAEKTMADFQQALAETLKNEGGYVNDPQDPGGETYKGISRKNWPKWEGWVLVDLARQRPNFPKNLDADAALQTKIAAFYEANFWDRVQGDKITDQAVAASIFDFAVNAGTGASIRLAQLAAGAKADGVLGDQSLAAINAIEPQKFLALFALNKVARYVHLCEANPDLRKFFYGWIKRTVGAL